jgi:hypothetical protein
VDWGEEAIGVVKVVWTGVLVVAGGEEVHPAVRIMHTVSTNKITAVLIGVILKPTSEKPEERFDLVFG